MNGGLGMDEDNKKRVNEYCEKQEIILKKERDKDLIKRGLYDIVKSDTYQEGYYYSRKHGTYIKKVAINITSEDYERIKRYKVNEAKPKESDGHLLFIGFIYAIIGIPIAIFIFMEQIYFGLLIVFITISVSVIYFALYKIINLLNKKI